ncbi:MAG: LytTR family transcriptional regulator, partial [Bryobacteraceae bacterium]|nr:LytTR family transcriptional regulator [Bryobacteraceae bacterium]
GNYTRLHFGAERPLIRRSLCGLEQQLGKVMFFRANRKQILNLNWIERTHISISGGLTAVLRGGQIVEMSRRQSERLRSVLSL